MVVGRAVASGRLSRAIYPLRALHEAPEVLQARARPGRAGAGHRRDADPDAGDPAGPTRSSRSRSGTPTSPGVLVRQSAIVGALTLLFERYWDQAIALPDLDTRPPARRRPRQPAAPARGRRQGRADRAHPRAQPAHRAAPGRRPDDRARGRHQVPGRRRGRAPRLALVGLVSGRRQHDRGTPRLDVPGTLPLGPVDLAVGRAPERLAGHRHGVPAVGSRRRRARGATPRGPCFSAYDELGERGRPRGRPSRPPSRSRGRRAG